MLSSSDDDEHEEGISASVTASSSGVCAAIGGGGGVGGDGKDESENSWRIPVVHFTEASAPFITCVGLNRTEGAFEANLASLNLRESVDYYHFC